MVGNYAPPQPEGTPPTWLDAIIAIAALIAVVFIVGAVVVGYLAYELLK
jgi:hypothetical protein